ncbi:hypothetical protein QBC45DRAFT_411922 [Copromyces sp. CBS 386.78]|nr:hypothetical protein QBC45DRAFT_411922 [Copromyces sp. CBS 386.78]
MEERSFGSPVGRGPLFYMRWTKSTEVCWIRQVFAKGIDAERPRVHRATPRTRVERHSQNQPANDGVPRQWTGVGLLTLMHRCCDQQFTFQKFATR